MRDAARISRTPLEWHDHQQAERERTLKALLRDLFRARDERAEWYRWIADGMPGLSRERYAEVSNARRRARKA